MSMRRTTIVLAVFPALWLAAQQPGADPNAAQKKIRLEGKVLSASGEPLSRASVRLLPQNNVNLNLLAIGRGGAAIPNPPAGYSAATDEQGRFVLDNVAPGSYQMIAERTGFVAQRYGARTPADNGTPLTLKEGDKLLSLEIKLQRQGVIAGRVTDRDGEPAVNIQVRASRYQYVNGKRQLVMAANTATDDRGDFRIGNLPPGRYFVIADPRPAGGRDGMVLPQAAESAAAGGSGEKDVTTYYPNSLDAAGAVQIEVTPGSETLGINIQMRRERVYTVRGAVADQTTNAAAAGAMLFPIPAEWSSGPPEGMLQISRARADGSFEIPGLLPGTYTIQGIAGNTLQLSGAGSGGGNDFVMVMRLAGDATESGATGRVEVTIRNEDVNGVGLLLTRGLEIPGTLRIDEGDLKDSLAPPPAVEPAPPPGLPALPAMGGRPSIRLSIDGVGVNVPSARIEEDGSFKLSGVTPGAYYVSVVGLQGVYIKQARFAGQDVTRRPIEITAAGGTLDLVVSKKVAELSGSAADSRGEPAAGATVSLWPKRRNEAIANGGVRTAVTDQNGAFKIANVIPDDYYVVAFDELPEPGLAQYAEFLNSFRSEAATVRLGESEKAGAQVKLVDRDRAARIAVNLR